MRTCFELGPAALSVLRVGATAWPQATGSDRDEASCFPRFDMTD